MENFGSEIGHKMRSAVKAKLLELGTGGSAGYIDDELPDYVMIMVANKRSKQQMINDLNLFLGSHTGLFVGWLHEVLQKLQEVTLPAVAVPKKRKSSHIEDATSNKRDKKLNKKDKKSQQHSKDSTNVLGSPKTNHAVTAIGCITDVFADEILEKEKLTQKVTSDTANTIKSAKGITSEEAVTSNNETNEFDIPTISEITSYVGGNKTSCNNREEDINELARIQKKIYLAKKHLRQIGELDKDETNKDLDEDNTVVVKEVHSKSSRKTRSPIVFEADNTKKISNNDEPQQQQQQIHNKRTSPLSTSTAIKTSKLEMNESVAPALAKKRPVHERLGVKQTHNQPEQKRIRQERKLYVPTARRNETGREVEQQQRHSEISEDLNRIRNKTAQSLRSTTKNQIEDADHSVPVPKNVRQRIGSRIIVASAKKNDSTDDECVIDKPMNSIIKIKPRPPMSPSKQASKNLLLRAVAEAQRSTTLAKLKESSTGHTDNKKKQQKFGTKTEIYSKNYRDNRKLNTNQILSPESFVKHKKENLVIEVKANISERYKKNLETMRSSDEEEEYVPETVTNDFQSSLDYTYVPNIVESTNNSTDEMSADSYNYKLENFSYNSNGSNSNEPDNEPTFSSQTQFVVTLTDKKTSSNFKELEPKSRIKLPLVSNSQKKNPNLRSDDTRTQKDKVSASLDSNINEKDNAKTSIEVRNTASYSNDDIVKTEHKPKHNSNIITNNNSDDNDRSSKKHTETKHNTVPNYKTSPTEVRSTTPPLPANSKKTATQTARENNSPKTVPVKQKRTPIKFDLDTERKEITKSQTKEGFSSVVAMRSIKNEDFEQEKKIERHHNQERRKISFRTAEAKKYDNIPSLSSVAIETTAITVLKPKERCKYHPNCTKQFCEFYHPSAPCKAFPNCKYADKCLYTHPKCKYDGSCTNLDCNYFHSEARNPNLLQPTAPPLSSHVVPVQNYKSISAAPLASNSMCKYYPDCTKVGCTFYHPKICRFGKNCVNKLECNFYHHEIQSSSKFKWVASTG